MDDVAPGVGENLEFDVVRVLDEFLDVDPRVPERLFCLGTGGVVAGDEGHVVVGDPHAATAATPDRLDEDGIPDLGGDRLGFLLVLNDSVGARGNLDPGFASERPADVLVLERRHRPRAGADEADVAARADLLEMGVLREESVPRMDGIHVGDLGGADDAVDAQVAFRGRTLSDADGLVGHVDVHGIGVGFGVDRDGPDVQFLASADDAHGDFPAIGDEDLLEHEWNDAGVSRWA